MKKTWEQAVSDNLWAAPAVFVTVAFVCFNFVGGETAHRVGWISYACGWAPALVMLGWCGLKRRAIGVGGVVSFSLLGIFALLFWLNHG
ncbi:hypothetical protein [Streptomyces sp. URMC 123]|uniref:hypothetical protein n=1 Tax=Streptomyces sp. URMC 123 TaxID=3423403 RepID=UPI003F19886B